MCACICICSYPRMYMYITCTCRPPPTYSHTPHCSHTPCSHEGQVRHYHIKQDESQKYFISEKHRFPTIKELIDYHKLNGGGLVTRLRKPPAQLAPNLHTLSPLFGKLFGFLAFLTFLAFWLLRLLAFSCFDLLAAAPAKLPSQNIHGKGWLVPLMHIVYILVVYTQ